ncbi:HAMP domain-containing protein [Actinomadura sp. HBU206391]|nr:HAMP domain-containing protein [Actinomadura sp. HBU206391]
MPVPSSDPPPSASADLTDGGPADPLDDRATALAGALGPPVLAPFIQPGEGSRLSRVRLGQWYGLGGGILALLLIAVLAQAGLSTYQQTVARDLLIEKVDPAALLQVQLSGSIGRQDSTIRQYAESGDPAQLAAYRQTITDQARISGSMRRLLADVPDADRTLGDIDRVEAAVASWRTRFAEPLAAPGRRPGRPSPDGEELSQESFVQIRTANATLQKNLSALHTTFADRLQARVVNFYWSFAAAVIIILVVAVGLAWVLRRTVLRPVSSLATNVRAVAQGDLAHPLDINGPAEFVELAAIVDAMRHRIMDEWRFTSEARRMLDEQATELRRSNAELEQFAYVASHDLQEPLRKVASFCQMLERRYGDQLDERGRQYIDFAVDGAKRMQALINDLLNFSRVGRVERREESVSMQKSLDRALYSLAQLREDTGAEVTSDELPELPGDQGQFTQLLQNLIGNALKFHGDDPPRVHIGARQDGAMWEFSCADNGIGIDAKYSDRIFLIFQRLHGQDVYAGTGIGLAMCRKIVEHHGGRIWLDTESDPDRQGTTIRWTLPAATPEPAATPDVAGAGDSDSDSAGSADSASTDE